MHCTEQNKISHLQLLWQCALFQVLGPGLLRPADMIFCFQNPVLKVLSEIFHCWVLDLVSHDHRAACLQWFRKKQGVSCRDGFTEVLGKLRGC